MTKLQSTLLLIAKKFDEAGICWGLGGSVLLMLHQLESNPHDIDVLVHLDDIEKARLALAPLGILHPRKVCAGYCTQYFDEYTIEGIDVDVMAGLTICNGDEKFSYPFDVSCIDFYALLNRVSIPLMYLEDWRVLYALMGRESKVAALDVYFDRLNSEESRSRIQSIRDKIYKIS